MSGAFLMSREIFGHEIWTDVAKFRIFFYIVGNAVWSEEGVKKSSVHVGRGQFLRSYRNIREDLVYYENNMEKRYSLPTIKRKIDELVEEEALKKEDTRLGTLFTVVNYERYQAFSTYSGGACNSKRTVNEQQTNSERTIRTKDIKDNKERDGGIDSLFDQWWDLYAKKSGGDKKKCRAKYGQLLKRHKHEVIMTGTERYHEWRKGLQERGEFCPQQKNPLTFLNGENFLDEYNIQTEQPRRYERFQLDLSAGEN